MRENQLKAKRNKKFKATTNSEHQQPVAENLLNREFRVSQADKVWVSDITYVWTDE
jgi:putative transposase